MKIKSISLTLSFSFRTGEDAIALRRQLRDCLQRATQAKDDQRQALLTIAIVGAGPAGLEMAATLADLLTQGYDRLHNWDKNVFMLIGAWICAAYDHYRVSRREKSNEL